MSGLIAPRCRNTFEENELESKSDVPIAVIRRVWFEVNSILVFPTSDSYPQILWIRLCIDAEERT